LEEQKNLKVIIIGSDSSFEKMMALQFLCSKLGIPVEVIKEKRSQDKDISEIIQELLLSKPSYIPEIPILEIPMFFKELPKKKKFFPSDVLKIISIAGQPKTVRIRSPCKTGIFIT